VSSSATLGGLRIGPDRGGRARRFGAGTAKEENLALPGSPAEFGSLMADETVKWAKVVKFFSGAKPESALRRQTLKVGEAMGRAAEVVAPSSSI
jgi:hypothetical protein